MGDESEKDSFQGGNGYKPIEVTPLQLLGVILKCVLNERITNEEIEKICSVYFQTLKDLWG